VKDLVKRLRRSRDMRLACGYDRNVPTEAHFSQMKKRIGVEGFRAIEAWLRHEALGLRESQPLSAVGLVQAACLDSTKFQAWSSRDPHDTSRGLGDPDARLGARALRHLVCVSLSRCRRILGRANSLVKKRERSTR